MKPTPLRSPPIVEALIDFRFQGSGSFGMKHARELAIALNVDGDQVEERHTFEGEITFGMQNAPQKPASMQLEAIVLRSTTGQVRQFRRAGFTVSLIRNYDRWEDLEALAETMFKSYVAASRPLALSRVATRFINVIEVPEPRFNLDDFLEAGPRIPPDSFDHVKEFHHRIAMGGNREGLMGILNLGTQRASPGQPRGLLVDVDCFMVDDLPIDFSAAKPILSELRSLKNALFFGSVKESALERYK